MMEMKGELVDNNLRERRVVKEEGMLTLKGRCQW